MMVRTLDIRKLVEAMIGAACLLAAAAVVGGTGTRGGVATAVGAAEPSVGAVKPLVGTVEPSVGAQGGVKTAPAYVPADRTPFVVLLSVRGLQPGGQYSVKVRLRSELHGSLGSTWNHASRKWVGLTAPWANQTTMTAGPEGALSGWLAARAGSKSSPAGEGTATVGLVLRSKDSGSNIEVPGEATATVASISQFGALGLIHGPVQSVGGTQSATAVVVRDSTMRVVGLTFAEPNGVDDDDDGVVDDEACPDVPGPRCFRLAVPALCLLDIDGPAAVRWSNQAAFPGLDLRVPRIGRSRSLSLAARSARVGWSKRTTLDALLGGSVCETVTIEKWAGSSGWAVLARLRTDASGRARCSVVCRAGTLFRVVWLGTPSEPPAVSVKVYVGVRPLLTARLSRRWVTAGRAVVVTGAFRPATGRRKLVVGVALRGRWRRLVVARALAVAGTYRCRFAVRRPGAYRVWVCYAGDQALLGGSVCAGVLSVR